MKISSTPADGQQVRETVRSGYAAIASGLQRSCCCGQRSNAADPARLAQTLGYDAATLARLPEGANMGLSCGNPVAMAALMPGQTVIDLGSGGGFDAFQAGEMVKAGGRVIGVDMTPEMVHKARENAAKGRVRNVDFRLGEIEHLPVADGVADVILSNCVINLSPDKPQVYAEAARALKPGGRLAISDVVAIAPIPARVKKNLQAHSGCIAGSATVPETEQMLKKTGFTRIRICVNERSKEFIKDWFPGSGAEKYVRSATIEAVKKGSRP